MALVGDNGAGKSTLIKCIAGIHPIDSGEIVFDGEPVNIDGPKDAARLGIEVVYQDLALADNLDVVQNMYLGRELIDRHAAARRDHDGGAREGDARLAVRDHPAARSARRWPGSRAGSGSRSRSPRP